MRRREFITATGLAVAGSMVPLGLVAGEKKVEVRTSALKKKHMFKAVDEREAFRKSLHMDCEQSEFTDMSSNALLTPFTLEFTAAWRYPLRNKSSNKPEMYEQVIEELERLKIKTVGQLSDMLFSNYDRVMLYDKNFARRLRAEVVDASSELHLNSLA
ncbi:MAG: hypothetical protein ACW99G_22250, partial [Candidatus Thorarchaeota archaeon]